MVRLARASETKDKAPKNKDVLRSLNNLQPGNEEQANDFANLWYDSPDELRLAVLQKGWQACLGHMLTRTPTPGIKVDRIRGLVFAHLEHVMSLPPDQYGSEVEAILQKLGCVVSITIQGNDRARDYLQRLDRIIRDKQEIWPIDNIKPIERTEYDMHLTVMRDRRARVEQNEQAKMDQDRERRASRERQVFESFLALLDEGFTEHDAENLVASYLRWSIHENSRLVSRLKVDRRLLASLFAGLITCERYEDFLDAWQTAVNELCLSPEGQLTELVALWEEGCPSQDGINMLVKQATELDPRLVACLLLSLYRVDELDRCYEAKLCELVLHHRVPRTFLEQLLSDQGALWLHEALKGHIHGLITKWGPDDWITLVTAISGTPLFLPILQELRKTVTISEWEEACTTGLYNVLSRDKDNLIALFREQHPAVYNKHFHTTWDWLLEEASALECLELALHPSMRSTGLELLCKRYPEYGNLKHVTKETEKHIAEAVVVSVEQVRADYEANRQKDVEKSVSEARFHLAKSLDRDGFFWNVHLLLRDAPVGTKTYTSLTSVLEALSHFGIEQHGHIGDEVNYDGYWHADYNEDDARFGAGEPVIISMPAVRVKKPDGWVCVVKAAVERRRNGGCKG